MAGERALHYTLHEMPEIVSNKSYASEILAFTSTGWMLGVTDFFVGRSGSTTMGAQKITDINPGIVDFLTLHQHGENNVEIHWVNKSNEPFRVFKTTDENGQERELRFFYRDGELHHFDFKISMQAENGDKADRSITVYCYKEYPIDIFDYRSLETGTVLQDGSPIRRHYETGYHYARSEPEGKKLTKAKLTITRTVDNRQIKDVEEYDCYAHSGDLRRAQYLQSDFPLDDEAAKTFFN